MLEEIRAAEAFNSRELDILKGVYDATLHQLAYTKPEDRRVVAALIFRLTRFHPIDFDVLQRQSCLLLRKRPPPR